LSVVFDALLDDTGRHEVEQQIRHLAHNENEVVDALARFDSRLQFMGVVK
jgi:hypothetical protein